MLMLLLCDVNQGYHVDHVATAAAVVVDAAVC